MSSVQGLYEACIDLDSVVWVGSVLEEGLNAPCGRFSLANESRPFSAAHSSNWSRDETAPFTMLVNIGSNVGEHPDAYNWFFTPTLQPAPALVRERVWKSAIG
jgi:hypothetical protein